MSIASPFSTRCLVTHHDAEKKLGKKLLGENDVDAVPQGLYRLMREEAQAAQTTATQTPELVYGLVENILTVRMVCLVFHAVLIVGISIYCGPGGSVLMDGVYYSGRNILSYAPFLFGADFLMTDISTSSTIIEEFMRSREGGLASVASFYLDFPDSSSKIFAASFLLSSLGYSFSPDPRMPVLGT